MDVSIIIVNYNTKEITNNCIESIFKYTSGLSYEVILVDNASIDGSADYFENDKRILLVKSDTNLGFGNANNLGYKYAKGKYLFFLNSDTLLLNNAIKEFYTQMELRGENVACLGCILLNSHNRRGHSYGNFPTIANELVRRPLSRFAYYLKAGFDDKPIRIIDDVCFEVEYICGADLFVRRTVTDVYGLFDPNIFMYYEDAEMQYRYRKNGYRNLIVNTPKIIHLEGGSQGKRTNIMWRSNDIASVLYCYRKMHGKIVTVIFKIIMLLVYFPLAIIDFRSNLHMKYKVLKNFFLL